MWWLFSKDHTVSSIVAINTDRVMGMYSYKPTVDAFVRAALLLWVLSLPFVSLLSIQRTGFLIVIGCLALWCVVNRQLFLVRTPVDMPLLCMIVWVGLSVPFAAFPSYSFSEFAKLLQQTIVFYAVVHFFRDPKDKYVAMLSFLTILLAASLYGIWQFDTRPWFGKDVPGGRPYYLIQSFFDAEVALTTFLVIAFPLAAGLVAYSDNRKLRIVSGITLSCALICQLLTFSRAGILAMLAEGIVFAVLLRKKSIAGFVGAAVLLTTIACFVMVQIGDQNKLPYIPVMAKLTTANLDARIKTWRLGYEQILAHPLVGIGYGKDTFQKVAQHGMVGPEDAQEVPMAGGTHNTALDVAVGAGLPAGIAFLWLMWTLGKRGVSQLWTYTDSLKKASATALVLMIIGFLIRNSFDHMWIGSLALLFWVFVGIFLEPSPNDTLRA
jgi:putative inorganic carbon (hco3(-)) transporter